MKRWLIVVLCLLSSASAAQAQGRRGDVRLMLETDFFRWTKVNRDDEQRWLALGPVGQGFGAMASLASGGLGFAITGRFILNGTFGVARFSDPDADTSRLFMRVLPDLDFLLVKKRRVAPYLTAGLPIALAKREGRRSRSLGPQGGVGIMAGPFHAEVTFAALFGKDKVGGSTQDSFHELTLGLSLGASLWL